MFDIQGKNVVIMGGGGILGRELALGYAMAGCNIAVCDLKEELAQETCRLADQYGVKTCSFAADACDEQEVTNVRDKIYEDFGQVHVLVNCVGGNMPAATTNDQVSFFDLSMGAIEKVVELNLMAGAVLPSKLFGKLMAKQEDKSSILMISSMNAIRPLTRIPGYSAAKAAVSNFTQWLAVDLARKYGEKIRVNALAPGFFLTTQSRFLLYDENTGGYSKRGMDVVAHTPMGKFGDPSDLIGAAVFLASEAAKFITGVVLPIDGGFSCYSGV